MVNRAVWIVGSVAAAAQGSIGNAVAGSLFAMGQSAGAGGTGAAVVNGAVQVGGAVMSLGSAGLAWAQELNESMSTEG